MKSRLGLLVTMALVTLLTTISAFAFKSNKTPKVAGTSEAQQKATSLYNDAVNHIDKAKKLGEKHDSTYSYNYGAATDPKVRNEYETAIKGLQQAVTLNPGYKEADNNLGYCYRKLGKLPESLSAYDKAIALDSNFAQAREYRGETYLALDRLEDAQKELAFLQSENSPYAIQLAHSIDLYKLWGSKKEGKPTVKW